MWYCVFFFFQAEDGIRDIGVTGVQTCALPIWLVKPLRLWRRPWRVVELWPEPGGAVTVGLEPAHRHGGRPWSFTAGAFARVPPRPAAFTPTPHPFPLSPSAPRAPARSGEATTVH